MRRARGAFEACGYTASIFHPGGVPRNITIKPAGLKSQFEKFKKIYKKTSMHMGTPDRQGANQIAAVIGKYGEGKSTFLKYIRSELIKQKDTVLVVVGYITCSKNVIDDQLSFSDLIFDILNDAVENGTLSEENYDKLKTKFEQNNDVKRTLDYGLSSEVNLPGYVFIFDELEEIIKELDLYEDKLPKFFSEFRNVHDEGEKTLMLFSCTPMVWTLIETSESDVEGETLYGYLRTRIGDKIVKLPRFTADIANDYIENALVHEEYIVNLEQEMENPFIFNSIRSLVLASDFSGRYFNELADDAFCEACYDGVDNNSCERIDYLRILSVLEDSTYFNSHLMNISVERLEGKIDSELLDTSQQIVKFMIGEFGEYNKKTIADRLEIEPVLIEKALGKLVFKSIDTIDDTLVCKVVKLDLEPIDSLEKLKTTTTDSALKDLFIESVSEMKFLEGKEYSFQQVLERLASGNGNFFIPEDPNFIQMLFECTDREAREIKELFFNLKEEGDFFRLSEPFYFRVFKLGETEIELDFGFINDKKKRNELRTQLRELDEESTYQKIYEGISYGIELLNKTPRTISVNQILQSDYLLSFEIINKNHDQLEFSVSVAFELDDTEEAILSDLVNEFYDDLIFQESNLLIIIRSVKESKMTNSAIIEILDKKVDLIEIPLKEFLESLILSERIINQIIMLSFIDVDTESDIIDQREFQKVLKNINTFFYKPLVDVYSNWLDTKAKDMGVYIEEEYDWSRLRSDYENDLTGNKVFENYYLNDEEEKLMSSFNLDGGTIGKLASGAFKPFVEKIDNSIRMQIPKEERLIYRIFYNHQLRDPGSFVSLADFSYFFFSKANLEDILKIYLTDLKLKKLLLMEAEDLYNLNDIKNNLEEVRNFIISKENVSDILKGFVDSTYCTEKVGRSEDLCKVKPEDYWNAYNGEDLINQLSEAKSNLIVYIKNVLESDFEIPTDFFDDSYTTYNETLNDINKLSVIEKYLDNWPGVLWKISKIKEIITGMTDLEKNSKDKCIEICRYLDTLEEEEEIEEDEIEREWDIEIESFPEWGDD